MQQSDDEETDNLRRMERFAWLYQVIEEAAREADPHRRLEDELDRSHSDDPPDHPPDRRAA